MPPRNPVLRTLHSAAGRVPFLLGAYRGIKNFLKTDPVVVAVYRNLFERNRLGLPVIEPEKLGPAEGQIVLPVTYPLFAGEDSPLDDLYFLLNLARGRKPARILEIGTYRARTTYALHLNCPESQIVSYDIQCLASPFRDALKAKDKVDLRLASFIESAISLRKEPKFDFIFIDGSHQFQHALEDSRLAFELVAQGGIIIWHDYRHNDYFNQALKVPEALKALAGQHRLYSVPHTMCAVYLHHD